MLVRKIDPKAVPHCIKDFYCGRSICTICLGNTTRGGRFKKTIHFVEEAVMDSDGIVVARGLQSFHPKCWDAFSATR